MPGAQLLFSTPVLTSPGQERFVINCDVSSLDSVLNALRKDEIQVEHLYDY